MSCRPLALLLLPLALPATAHAGMPSYRLTDLAHARLEIIGFFLAIILLSALAIKSLWNAQRKTFPRLPHLSYLRALGLVTLWSFLFLLVLTMISGARELMTPGAWEKIPGHSTYRLSVGSPSTQPYKPPTDADRKFKLLALHTYLRSYAAARRGSFPPTSDSSIPDEVWQSPDLTRARYLYFPQSPAYIAIEPAIFNPRFALTPAGDVVSVSDFELAQAFPNTPATQPVSGEK